MGLLIKKQRTFNVKGFDVTVGEHYGRLGLIVGDTLNSLVRVDLYKDKATLKAIKDAKRKQGVLLDRMKIPVELTATDNISTIHDKVKAALVESGEFADEEIEIVDIT